MFSGLQRLSQTFIARSGPVAALAGVIVFALFIAIVLPRQAARTAAEVGDAGSPDGSTWYSAEELYAFAEAYGPEGRDAYVRARWTFDVIWPLAYLFFFTTTISWLLRRAFPAGSRWRLLNLAPLIGALFDLLENSATSLVMARYPAQTPVVDILAPVFTLLKWVFVNGSFAVLAAVAVVALWRSLTRRTSVAS